MPQITVSKFCTAVEEIGRYYSAQELEPRVIGILDGKEAEGDYCPEMTFLEFFARGAFRNHDPATLANKVASALNVSPAFELKDLVIA